MEHKGGHYDACIVCTVVCQKAPVTLKQCQTVQACSLSCYQVTLDCKSESQLVNQSVSQVGRQSKHSIE